MKSIKFSEFGNPVDVLRVEDVEQPEPSATQVLIKLRARSINPSDLLTVRGLYGQLPKLPATPGLEAMGEVVEAGADVRKLHTGQRVIPLRVIGTWQEFIVADEAQCLPVPDAVSDNTAAQFVVNPLTAWIMTIEELKMKPGEWLLQTAAGSTLGRIVLQIARLHNFKTINVVRRREQIAELKALGATQVIATDTEDIATRVKEITGKDGVVKAIEAVGGETGARTLNALGRGGEMLVYGLLSGEPIAVDGGRMIFASTVMRGFWLSEWIRTAAPQTLQSVTAELLKLMASGEIEPPVEAEYQLTDIIRAVTHAERTGRGGKVLLVS
ncbi:MAG: zinc-dependent alcohol dehydrogenase family protein [Pyrinomonadaceae bacterium MAG19_C2-C3]|nr:zinc-dependent alcohol dehydrogenase family protein [Pyrinomonadaceae bacterium MAG19_C2-C3]